MTSTTGPGIIARAWFKWKALRLPWRKTWLVGHDLAGNTFWEFKDALNANRLRRIMKHGGRPMHYADVRISPQWHQWLRHTRDSAPSMQEQQYDVSRQARMKQLAADADERWKSIPSYLDAPSKQQPQPAIGVQDPASVAPQTEPEERQGVINGAEDAVKVASAVEGKATDEGRLRGSTRENKTKREKEESPYQRQQKGAPGEGWQPDTWSPGVVQRR